MQNKTDTCQETIRCTNLHDKEEHLKLLLIMLASVAQRAKAVTQHQEMILTQLHLSQMVTLMISQLQLMMTNYHSN
mgnify:CR=1 FL=1